MLDTSSTVAWIWVSGMSGVKMKTLVPKFGALVDHPGEPALARAGVAPRKANMPPIKVAMIRTRLKICPVYKVIFSSHVQLRNGAQGRNNDTGPWIQEGRSRRKTRVAVRQMSRKG